MIDYSVSARVNPRDREAPSRYYGSIQVTKVMELDEFSRHISTHGSVYRRSDINAVLTMAVDCLREMLLNGYKVNLGDLGSFYPTMQSHGTESPSDFRTEEHVKRVNVIWERGPAFEDLQEDAEFNLVAIRAVQRQVLKAVKKGETVVEF